MTCDTRSNPRSVIRTIVFCTFGADGRVRISKNEKELRN